MKAIGVFFGGFPNEFTLINEIKYKNVDLESKFIGYLIGIFLFTLAGIYY